MVLLFAQGGETVISGPAEASVSKGSPGGFLVKRILFIRFHVHRETGPSVAR